MCWRKVMRTSQWLTLGGKWALAGWDMKRGGGEAGEKEEGEEEGRRREGGRRGNAPQIRLHIHHRHGAPAIDPRRRAESEKPERHAHVGEEDVEVLVWGEHHSSGGEVCVCVPVMSVGRNECKKGNGDARLVPLGYRRWPDAFLRMYIGQPSSYAPR